MNRSIATTLTLALLLTSAPAPFAATRADDLRIGGYVLAGKTRVGPLLWNLSYRASLTNRGTTDIAGASATLRILPDYFIVDGRLDFGPVQAGRTVTSTDTFTLRSIIGQGIDPRLLERYLRWSITITGVANNAPVAAAGPDRAALVGDTVTLDGSASHDADGDTLTYAWSIVSQPAGGSVALGSATQARATLVPDRAGDYVVQLVVGDGIATSTPDTATVSVTAPPPPNRDPQITSAAVTAGEAGSPYGYQVVATDADGDALAYSLTVAPAGMSIGATGLVAWTPGAVGHFDVTILVTDGRGGQATQSFTLVVEPPPGVPAPTVVVDPALPIEVTTVPGLGDEAPRPVTALTDRSNIPMHFVANELIVVSNDASAVADLALRYGGTVVQSFVPGDYGLPGTAQHLVRIDPSTVDPSGLVADLQALEPAASNALRVANDAALRLLAAAAHENVGGTMVGLNLVMQPTGIPEGSTAENPSLVPCPNPPAIPPGIDNCVRPIIAPAEAFDTDAFKWSYMQSGGMQNIGVGEAWRSLSYANLLDGPKVAIGVIDGGFSPNAIDNPVTTEYHSNGLFDEDGYPQNELTCTGGVPCPYHGANAVSAAMGPADDGKGAAGPGGPVARAITIRYSGDAFNLARAFGIAVTRGARIINMSFGERVPATLSWTREPFNLLTATAHGIARILLIASAGNDNQDVDSEDCVPFAGTPCWEDAWYAPCENDGVLCVGALADNSTTRRADSNYGSEDVDLFGPGDLWVGGDPGDPEPHLFGATSAAAPFVAGVASLVMAADPRLFGDQVESMLIQTASPSSDPGVRRYVNARAAVNLALGGSPVCTPPTILTSTPDHPIRPCLEQVFEVTHSQAFGPFRYQWRRLDLATDQWVDLPEGGRFSGTTTARMTISPFLPGDEGRYDVVVGNLCGAAESGSTLVSVVDGALARVPSLPAPRAQVGMAFDRGRGRLVLFGGRTSSADFEGSNETWERDANGAWQVVATEGPGRRFDSFMAYDEARGVTVLFGGATCNPQCGNLEDTWEWNGTTWTERPAAGFGSATRTMTYDSVRRRVVRFDYQYNVLEWNGTDWTRRGTSMDPVNGQPTTFATNSAVTFDRNRNVYVLQNNIDTWELDGSGQWWLRKRPDTSFGVPFFMERSSMSFDSDKGRTLFYSGVQLGNNLAEGRVLEWTGSTWERKVVGLLPAEQYPHLGMAYDSTRRRTVLTGVGYPPSNSPSIDVFEWRYFVDDPTCALGPQ